MILIEARDDVALDFILDGGIEYRFRGDPGTSSSTYGRRIGMWMSFRASFGTNSNFANATASGPASLSGVRSISSMILPGFLRGV